ncbi:MAG: hypothetical protein B7733_24655 [Myxococcales bacterium FL481]|nr:MAG: hypothetical protein B7733_24655 [Myxococcales bacterium FL481]
MPTTTKMDGNDIDITNCCSALVEGAEAVVAIVEARLQTASEEWFLGIESVGVPMWQTFLVNNPNPHLMQSQIRRVIDGADPELTVTRVDLNVDPEDPRTLQVEWEAVYRGELLSELTSL